MHSFKTLEAAVATLTQFGYEYKLAGPNGMGFSKGAGRAARLAVLARKGNRFVIRYV
jgi:hypothetical protein